MNINADESINKYARIRFYVYTHFFKTATTRFILAENNEIANAHTEKEIKEKNGKLKIFIIKERVII